MINRNANLQGNPHHGLLADLKEIIALQLNEVRMEQRLASNAVQLIQWFPSFLCFRPL